MKPLIFYIVFLCVLNVNAQQSSYANLDSAFTESSKTTFLNSTETLYQVNLVSEKHKNFSCLVNFRMEDELISDSRYSLLNDITFFDIQLNYEFGPFDLCVMIDNLLGFNDTDFAIETVLDSTVINEVYFSHEANFLLSTRITYNF